MRYGLVVLGTLRKLVAMSWEQVYRDPGLKWELVHSRKGPNDERVYSFRIGKEFRALAYRDPDHGSAAKNEN